MRLLREDFSYAMVHDMKSPLTSIIMGNQISAQRRTGEEAGNEGEIFLYRRRRGTASACSHQPPALPISKLEHGKLNIQKAEINLETMIEDVVDKYKAKSAKPIHITTYS